MNARHNCMKPRGAVFATICAAAFVGAAAFGGITHTYEDNDATLVVTVDSGSETMDASWVTAPDSATGATVTKIKKEGAGTLVAVSIPTFAGDFSIEAGVYSYLEVGDFGATNAAFMTADDESWRCRNEKTLEWMKSLKARGRNGDFRRRGARKAAAGDLRPPRERIGLPASELCFIDDLEKNINAGEEVAKKAARTVLQNTCTGMRKAL